MTDTPQHIKDLQLKIWLSKPPMKRLEQFLIDNESLFKFWRETELKLGKEGENENVSSKQNNDSISTSVRRNNDE